MAIGWLNGEWGDTSSLKISVLDRGFLFGDGVYEVISVYNAVPFALEQHLDRLERSLKEVAIPWPVSREALADLIREAIERSQAAFSLVYLQVTRGADDKRHHVYPEAINPSLFLMATPTPHLQHREIKPLTAITMEDYRWSKGHIKSVSILANGLLRNAAVRQDVDDALLLRDGWLTESTASNVFIVINGEIRTPPKSNHLLHGITRDLVLELAATHGMKAKEIPVSIEDLRQADEIWITNTSQEVWPVGVLDGQPVNNGGPGPVFADMDACFQALKRKLCGDW